jgi:branched-chain amino acid transport system substrate-binding protein
MKIRTFIVFLLIVSLIAACAPKEAAPIVIPAGEKVILGLSSALSGSYAVYGQDMLNGVTLAVQDFGGALKGWELEIEGGDDLCEGAPGVTVAEKFSADPYLLGVIGPMCSPSIVPATDVYAANFVVMITPSGTAVAITARGFKNIFRTVANDDLQAEATVDYMLNELGLKSLAVIHDQSIYGQGVAEAVRDKFEASGGSITGIEGITRGEMDFSAVIAIILKDNPDIVYWGGMDAEGALIVNQLRAAGFEGVFFGPDGIKSKPSYVDASGGAAEGSFMTFGAVGGATGYDEFEVKFKEQFGDPVAYGPGSYDAALIMLNAADAVAFVDEDGNLNIPREALAEMIRATPHNGITGFLEFDENGDLKVVSITVFKVVDGEIVPMKTYDFGE